LITPAASAVPRLLRDVLELDEVAHFEMRQRQRWLACHRFGLEHAAIRLYHA